MATKNKSTYPNALLVLWKNKSKDGKTTFLSNKAFIGFYNTNKKNPKEPDLEIYQKDENGKAKKEPYCILWCNLAKDGKTKYLTGKVVSTGQKVTGFITKSNNEKAPYINVYLAEQLKNLKDTEAEVDVETDDDLPF